MTKPAKLAKPHKRSKPTTTSTSAASTKVLLGLDPSFDRPPDRPVAEMMQGSRNKEALANRYQAKLLAGTKLVKSTLTSLAGRRTLLENAEAAWAAQKTARLTKDEKKLEAEATLLKQNMIAALRYFLADNAAVQLQVDSIQEGTGLADLVADLGALAKLVSAQAAGLRKAELPKGAAQRARDLARLLGAGNTDSASDAEAQSLRNRAFWYLHQAFDEICAAGRYVFRGNVKIAKLFRSTPTHSHASRKPVPPAPISAPAPGTPATPASRK